MSARTVALLVALLPVAWRHPPVRGARRGRGVSLLLASVLAGACHRSPAARVEPPRAASIIPRNAYRFEVERVEDSVAYFRPAEIRWLKPGMSVYAVDPSKRDALVARLRIVDRDSVRMRAVIVGQTTDVSMEHVLLAVQPPRKWYREPRFWGGLITGLVTGSGVVAFFQ